MESTQADAWDARSERAGGLKHKVVGTVACLRRAGPPHGKGKRAATRKAQAIAKIRERNQAFNVMIAVGAAAKDAQRQIDFGRRAFNERSGWPRTHPPLPTFLLFAASAAEEVSSGNPALSFSSIFGRSSGSGFKSLAWDH